jgi:hypothetical protein
MLIGQVILWLALALGISRFDTSSLVRRRWRRGVVRHEAPLLSIDAPIHVAVIAPTDELLEEVSDEPAIVLVDAPTEAGVE